MKYSAIWSYGVDSHSNHPSSLSAVAWDNVIADTLITQQNILIMHFPFPYLVKCGCDSQLPFTMEVQIRAIWEKKNYYEDSSEEYCCGSFHSRERERQTATDRERGEGGKEKEREKLTLELCLPIVLQQLDLCPH